ncbi:MAG: polyphosphate polymerase domain-containing protein [Bacteroidales bacterium]|nr:polyphosphate polymerase domain-containing protein [Bacteroidales bacterium]
MLAKITAILEKMDPITLDEMKSIRLMDRIDSKFVAPVALLPQLLEEMKPYFKVQINNGTRIAPYTTQYLDTPQMDMFTMHQNGKLNRQKIRIRSYVDSKISFLEVKNKNNKGRTKKIRVPIDISHVDSINDLEANIEFLKEHSLFESLKLEPSLANTFSRITLVNNRKTERITIDINLVFFNYRTGKKKELEQIMILELKQDGWQRSDFRDILMKLRIKKTSFSKYCMGLVYTNPHIKYNRFKARWQRINKL